jgi:hypothetical protein
MSAASPRTRFFDKRVGGVRLSGMNPRPASQALIPSLMDAARSKAHFSRIALAVGNFVVFDFLIGSISWFYLPIDCSISWYSPRKIATCRANICGGK